MTNVAVIGASGSIGSALVEALLEDPKVNSIYAYSRSIKEFSDERVHAGFIDLEDEASIIEAARRIDGPKELHLVFVATGILHTEAVQPEKSLRDLSTNNFERLFSINTIGPALVAKHFIPLLSKNETSAFAMLSARVGSISDNHLGGWYAYRASKAALNMIIKTLSIELSRKNKQAFIVGMHPGTVDSPLSKPFHTNVSQAQLFSPSMSAHKMLQVLGTLTPAQTGCVFDYKGSKIEY